MKILIIILILAKDVYGIRNFSFGIIGGHGAEFGEFPAMVSIQTRGYAPFCGATLISDDMVLTAAHCLFYQDKRSELKSLRLMMGDISIKLQANASTRIYRDIYREYIHPEYNELTYGHDLAILELDKPVHFVKNILEPASLSYDYVPFGSKCWIAGWGSMRYGDHTMQPLLKKAMIFKLRSKACEFAYKGKFNREIMICAGSALGHRDSCQGDSGGGLYFQNQLVGVVSFGTFCGNVKFPGVYVRISPYKMWIMKIVSHTYDGTYYSSISRDQSNLSLIMLLINCIILWSLN